MIVGSISSNLKRLDLFGANIPQFRLRTKSKVNSAAGGCLTLITTYVIFLFALLKFEHLMLRKNPAIAQYK